MGLLDEIPVNQKKKTQKHAQIVHLFNLQTSYNDRMMMFGLESKYSQPLMVVLPGLQNGIFLDEKVENVGVEMVPTYTYEHTPRAYSVGC